MPLAAWWSDDVIPPIPPDPDPEPDPEPEPEPETRTWRVTFRKGTTVTVRLLARSTSLPWGSTIEWPVFNNGGKLRGWDVYRVVMVDVLMGTVEAVWQRFRKANGR